MKRFADPMLILQVLSVIFDTVCDITFEINTDTGCQSCLAGSNITKKLGISAKDLLPMNQRMHAANNDDINILGAAILQLTATSAKGTKRSTICHRQR